MSATPLAQPTITSHARAMLDPEVRERPVRRHFSAEYKLRIVEEAERATEPGDIGSLLRREGLYSSHLTEWRRLHRAGALQALARPRGRPRPDPLAAEVERLTRRTVRLEADLARAHRIIEIRSKVSELLGIPLARSEDDGSGS
jgi:transposase-like protein